MGSKPQQLKIVGSKVSKQKSGLNRMIFTWKLVSFQEKNWFKNNELRNLELEYKLKKKRQSGGYNRFKDSKFEGDWHL